MNNAYLYNFVTNVLSFSELLEWCTEPTVSFSNQLSCHPGDFISRMFVSGESFKEAELEKYCDYESVEVPDSYTGPRLSFPLLPEHATALLEAFKQKQVRTPKATALSPSPQRGVGWRSWVQGSSQAKLVGA